MGSWDRFVGPGWTRPEKVVLYASIAMASVALPLVAAVRGYPWSGLQSLVAALLAFDIVGGAVTMATNPGKAWYHRPGQGFRQHLAFVAVHVHPFLVAWLFVPSMDWSYALGSYGYLLVLSVAILRAPLYLKRPMAAGAIAIGCLANGLILTPPLGMAWFLPVFYIKLFSSHLVPETRFRPE